MNNKSRVPPMSHKVNDRELSSALGSLFKRFNRLTERKLGEQILLLEYKLRCVSKFRNPMMTELNQKELGHEMDKLGKRYDFILRRYRSTCFIGKLRIFWHQFNK